jgi:integrase
VIWQKDLFLCDSCHRPEWSADTLFASRSRARHFHRPPDQLTPEHIREYQAYVFRERKLAASTVTQRLAALRFFYTQTIKKAWSVADTPYPKKTRPLPSILSPEEVAHLIDSSQTRFHRMVLMTLYGTGVRRAELARLQISDIDSRRMVIHIRSGKGRQDRDVMLSPTLEALRDYWRSLKRKPIGMVISGRVPAHLQSSHHSPSGVVCVPTCCPAGGTSEPGSSPHAAPLFRYALAGKRSGPAHHSTAPGTSRSEGDHDLSSSLATASQRHRESAGLAQVEK